MRSSYSFIINSDINEAKKVIDAYIKENGFNIVVNNGESYFVSGNKMNGYRYFNYQIIGNNLTIYAWFKGLNGEVGLLENNRLTFTEYGRSLDRLFSEINRTNKYDINENMSNDLNYNNSNNIIGYDTNTGKPIYNNVTNFNNNYYQNNQNQFSGSFNQEINKNQEIGCEICFWISILGLIASFFGILPGAIIYMLVFYYAVQGLKTRKKAKAVATIVISIISIIILILTVILNAYIKNKLY